MKSIKHITGMCGHDSLHSGLLESLNGGHGFIDLKAFEKLVKAKSKKSRTADLVLYGLAGAASTLIMHIAYKKLKEKYQEESERQERIKCYRCKYNGDCRKFKDTFGITEGDI